MRNDGRTYNELRSLKITRSYLKYPEGSALIELGDTHVICTASVEEKVPQFLNGTDRGWITAEYAMLPRSTSERVNRERIKVNARSLEIQRLIGRSLRAVADLSLLGAKTIWLDCDVLQADGGTRTAAISGAYVALAEAFFNLLKEQRLDKFPLGDYLAAVSVGLHTGEALLDLNYEEDSAAAVDMNIVMTGSGKMVEVQGSAEENPFSRDQLEHFVDLAAEGIAKICTCQKEVLGPQITKLIEQ
ncbi:MAG: ribonuclease PH [Bacillota bacterium]|nr:ribonuclease PH [Bacillota bacterium]